MVVKNAVKVLVDVVEHVDHFHGRAVVAERGKAHDVTEIDGDLLKQLWLHFARLLQGAHHRAGGTGKWDSYLLGSHRVRLRGEKTSTKSRKNSTSSTDSNLFKLFSVSSIQYAENTLPPTFNGSTSVFFKVQNSLSLSACLKWLIKLMKAQFAWS